MNLINTVRRIGIAAIAAGAATAALGTLPAQADTTTAVVRPMEAEGCNSNICIQVTGGAGGTVQVIGWAKSTTYTGTLSLTGPNGSGTTSSGTWLQNKDNDKIWNVVNAPAGTYCASGTSTSGTHEGTACEGVS
ncbi:hypothetical protein GXW82_13620 [Streptacidiphilus sp. 4-A2]|nr:hypothetical protein [Streptacidiphilus sp. 4-A2]